MSRGYCASCRMAAENEQEILYEYTCYNIGEGDWKRHSETYDGSILIQKAAFAEPYIHMKKKKMPSGRKKLIVKRIRSNVDYSALLSEGRITIENCSGAWQIVGGVDFMALRLIWKIFDEYQDIGEVPEKMSYCS
ncbi:MAG: hypothetical protein J1E39_09100 [Eubacterium sp.]|nr:hypothetical protein [Eubacterium sp.]